MPVTNDNKLHYLNCLAQYRLVSSCREEVEAFLKGLNLLIPDNLLSIFDENELEVKCSTCIHVLVFFCIKASFSCNIANFMTYFKID